MRRATLSLFALVTLTGAARAEDAPFELKKAEAKAPVGVRSVTSVTIAARPGWHLNEDFPTSLKLTPDPGVTVEKPKMGKADAAQKTPESARFDVAFTASEPGKKTINGEARFAVCQATTCRPMTEKFTLALDVAAPEPAPAAPVQPANKTKKTKKRS